MPITRYIRAATNRIRRYVALANIKRAGVWFVDIPRTSSTSIKTELRMCLGWPYGKSNVKGIRCDVAGKPFNHPRYAGVFTDHLTVQQLLIQFGETNYDRLFTFTVVRNPWSRMVSNYKTRVRGKQISADFGMNQYIHLFKDQPDHAALDHTILGRNMLSQYKFLSDASGNLRVSRIVRFENREAELQELANTFPKLTLGSSYLQRGHQAPDVSTSHLDQKSIEIVAELFHDDIEFFKYRYPE